MSIKADISKTYPPISEAYPLWGVISRQVYGPIEGSVYLTMQINKRRRW